MLYKDHSLKIASPEILKKITRKDKTIRHCEELQRRGNLLFQQEIASSEFTGRSLAKTKQSVIARSYSDVAICFFNKRLLRQNSQGDHSQRLFAKTILLSHYKRHSQKDFLLPS
jgi:hypothetical protein